MAPMAMAIPPEAHDVGAHPQQPHHDEREENAEGEGDDGDQRGAEVEQEQRRDGGDHQGLLDQLAPEGGDRPVDQVAPVVGGPS